MYSLFNLRLTTISPVYIGDQSSISPYSDYICKEDKIHYIDEDKLKTLFMSSGNIDELLDEYIEAIKVKAFSDFQNKYNLEMFFERHGLDIEEYTSYILPINTRVNKSIETTIKTSGRPYIPGSSIKGAIRTTLLYHHNSGYSEAEIKDFNVKSRLELSNLLISDTNPISMEDLIVLRTGRYNLAIGIENRETIYESINKDTNFEFTIKTIDTTTEGFEYLNGNSLEGLFSIINSFYQEAIQRELEVLKKHTNPQIQKILDFYHYLNDEINKAMINKDFVIMRIGAGKTFFESSIGMGLEKEDLDTIIKRAKIGKAFTDKNFFPKTRTFVGNDGSFDQVLGWIKIESMGG